jgi:NodT family efflux transporter outer membrane factor (OMF) lipoprotein
LQVDELQELRSTFYKRISPAFPLSIFSAFSGGARLFFAALLLLSLAAGTGCAPQAEPISPPMSLPDAFSASGSRKMPDKWWRAFSDPAVNDLVNRALAANFDLKTAWQRLRAARAVAERESAARYPDLEAQAQGEASRSESTDTDKLRLGLLSAYEVDLWGRIESAAEAEEYRAEASLFDYQTAALSLSAQVVRTWYQMAAAAAEHDLLEAQVQANRKVLALLENRFASGLTRGVDVLRQRQLLEATREQRLAVESRIQVLRHQIAVLCANPPQKEAVYEKARLPELPPLPQTGLPSGLVRRRPDIRRAYKQLQAADRDLAAAVSSRYPRLNLTASLATSSRGAGTLFEDWLRSVSAELAAPLFDAGRRRAEARRAGAVKRQRLYAYGQSILTAFREVEDALVREEKQRRQLESIGRQVRLAKKSYAQLRIEYINGAGDFIDALTALTELQQLRRDRVSARLLVIEYRIALYRSLAGAFEQEAMHRQDPFKETAYDHANE